MIFDKKTMRQLVLKEAGEIFRYIKEVFRRYGQEVGLPELSLPSFCREKNRWVYRQMFRYDTEHLRTWGRLRALRVEIALSSSGKFEVDLHFDLPDAPTQTFQLE